MSLGVLSPHANTVMGISKKLFKIESGELGKILDFALLGALMQAGISIGTAAADALFLSKIGAQQLPTIYLLTPLIFLAYIPVYSYLINRLGITQVFQITIAVLALGGIGLYSIIGFGPAQFEFVALYIAKLYSFLWYIALYSLFWNFVDGYFDILDAKRIFAALSAGCALGAALGGGLVTLLSNSCPAHELFLAWSVIACCSFPVLNKCVRKWRILETEEINSDSSALGVAGEMKSLVNTFRTSSFAVLLGSLLFCTMIVTLVCEYQFSNILSQGRSEAELTALFGSLFLIVNSFNLFVNLFIFNRLALNLGVRNVALIQPVVYTLSFILFIVDGSIIAGIFGFFAFHGILTSIDFNNTNLLINALPKEKRRQLRTFIEGICEPMANAVAGGFLFFLVATISPNRISALGLIAALGCFTIALTLRGAYVRSMVANLKQSWLDFSSASQLHAIDANGLGDFEKFLNSSHSLSPRARHYFEASLVRAGAASVPICVKVLRQTRNSLSARSIAARALSRLSSQQLESVSSNVVNTEISRALIYAKHAKIFSNAIRTSLGQVVLAKYCRDQHRIILDFVLELLALNGRVADVELLISNLRSHNPKERADAIETIQQACDSKTNNLLLPMLSIKTDFDQANSTESSHINSNAELYECLVQSFASSNELEVASATEALVQLSADLEITDQTALLLRRKLSSIGSEQSPSPFIVDTIVSALIGESQNGDTYTLIKKIALLQQSEFLNGFSSEDLKAIAAQSRVVEYAAGTKLELNHQTVIMLLLRGQATDKTGQRYQPNALLGEALIYDKHHVEPAKTVTQNITVIEISCGVVMNRMKKDTALSLYILKRRFARADDTTANVHSRLHLFDNGEVISA